MKNTIFAVLFTCLGVTQALAQGPAFRLGIEGGPNLNKISGESFNQQFNFNYYVGAFANLGFTKGFGIQPELLFSQSSASTTNNFSSTYSHFLNYGSEAGKQRRASLNYLNIPILASFALASRIYLQFGPQFSVLMNQNKDLVDNGKQAFKDGDLAMVGGIWIRLPFHLNLSGRYVIGLHNVNDLGNQDRWTNQSIQLGLGLTL
jgi:hypothetical protein